MSLTQGSVVFAGAGGVLSEDNANFFYDATNHRLGLGTPTPTRTLDVHGGLNQQDGLFNLAGNGNCEIETTGTLYIYSTLDTAYDSDISMSIGYSNCTGIALGNHVIGTIYCTYLGQNGLIYLSEMPNGANAIGHYFATEPTYTTLGAKLVAFFNGTQGEKASISKDGDWTGRRRMAGGTSLVAGDFALSAGWGNTAAISAVQGNDSHFTLTVTANGTGKTANPTITLTFKEGAFPAAPFAQIQTIGASSAANLKDALTWVPTATGIVMTYHSTPANGDTFTITGLVVG